MSEQTEWHVDLTLSRKVRIWTVIRVRDDEYDCYVGVLFFRREHEHTSL